MVKGFGTLKMVFFWNKRFDGGGQTSSLQSSSSKKDSGLFWHQIFWFVFQKEKAREKLERAERCYRKCIFFQGSIFQPAMLVYRSVRGKWVGRKARRVTSLDLGSCDENFWVHPGKWWALENVSPSKHGYVGVSIWNFGGCIWSWQVTQRKTNKNNQNVAKAENLWLKTSFEPQPKKNKHLTSCDQVASPSPRTWASQKNSQLLEEMSDDFRKILKNIPGFKKKNLL